MKIFLHIGNYKTGTTAVQSFLTANRERLQDLGFFIPEVGLVGSSHHDWAASLLARPGAADPDELYPRIRESLARCGYDKAIVSTELFFSGGMAAALVERLPGHEIAAIAYLRRQDEFASAFYMQLVKHPNFMEANPPSVSRYVGKLGAADYLGCLNRWAQSIGSESMIVRPYEREQLPHGLIHDFLQCVGVAPDAFPDNAGSPTLNATIETELIEFLRIANSLGLSKEEHASLLAALTEISRRGQQSELLHKSNVFSPAQRREILGAAASDNEEIARRFLGRSDGALFLDPPPDDDPTWAPGRLSVDALAQIVAALWISQQKELANLVAASGREFNDRLVGFLHGKLAEEWNRAEGSQRENAELRARIAELERGVQRSEVN
jgi:hypothetical protein